MAFSEIVTTPGHVFYGRLNTVLNAEKFDQRIEVICRKYSRAVRAAHPSRLWATIYLVFDAIRVTFYVTIERRLRRSF